MSSTPTKNVDVIITYVNNSDRAWVQSYVKTTQNYTPPKTRYRSWGTLRYLLRGIETCMPFVRNIVLVVAQPSQVPIWLNKDTVRVVYHDEFIPKQFLPTFNSCTIESFFFNIPDLADRVIYFNDDMFPINPLKENDFFTGDKPHIVFTEPETYSMRNVFRNQCRSGIDLITKTLNLPKFEPGKIIRPYHITTAITKDTLAKVKELCESAIPDTITTLRAFKNVNQYIYAYYNYFTDNYVPKTVNYEYFEISDKTIKGIIETISGSDYQMVCLNDSDQIKDYSRVRYLLNTCFADKFSVQSKYELFDD